MITIEGAGELNPVARAALLRRPPVLAPPTAIPIILSATKREARGAGMHVGGLRVVDRALRLLAGVRDAQIVIVTDGSIPLPRRLPSNMERRVITGDPSVAIGLLLSELGAEATVVHADTVWLQPGGFASAVRVLDAASRRAADGLIFRDGQREAVGIVDRLLNQKICSRVTRLLFARLPVSPSLLTLVAGFVGLCGALLVAGGSWRSVIAGFAILEAFVILDGCAIELARVRLHQTVLGAWVATVVGDLVNVATILAVGVSLWRQGGTYLDMKMALAAAAMTLFYAVVSYAKLLRQGEGDVMKVGWWFTHGRPLKTVHGTGVDAITAVMLLGRRDSLIVLALGLACLDQLPNVLICLMIVAMVRAAGALGQLFAHWRLRPPV